MLWHVKALGRFAQLGCCACEGSRFIRAATACCGLERLYVDCAAYKIPLSQSERVNSYPRKIHYQHATPTAFFSSQFGWTHTSAIGALGVTDGVMYIILFYFPTKALRITNIGRLAVTPKLTLTQWVVPCLRTMVENTQINVLMYECRTLGRCRRWSNGHLFLFAFPSDSNNLRVN